MGTCQSKSPQLGIKPNNVAPSSLPASSAIEIVITSSMDDDDADEYDVVGHHYQAGDDDDDDDDEGRIVMRNINTLMKKDYVEDGIKAIDTKFQIYTLSSPSEEQTAATELPTPLSMFADDGIYSPSKSSAIRSVGDDDHDDDDDDDDAGDDYDQSRHRRFRDCKEDRFEVMSRLEEYGSPEHHMNTYQAVEKDRSMSSTSSPSPSPCRRGPHQSHDVSHVTDKSYLAYDYDIDCDDSAELPPLHIDDAAIKRIRERLANLDDKEDTVDYESDNHNTSTTVNSWEGGQQIHLETPVLDIRKTQPSKKAVPYSPRPTPSLRRGGDEDDEDDGGGGSNITRSVDDLNRLTPLVAPPRDAVVSLKDVTVYESSVDPKAISLFNKLKVQVEQAAIAEEKQKREKKLQDRRAEVNGYRNLWNDYQNIQEQMQETKIHDGRSEERLGDGLLLLDPSTWFVDFRTMNAVNHLDDQIDEEDESSDDDSEDDDDDDVDSIGSSALSSRDLSLASSLMSGLSQSDQSSQKRLFQRIALQRNRRSGAYTVGSSKGDISYSTNRHIRIDDDDSACISQESSNIEVGIKYTTSNINGVTIPLVASEFQSNVMYHEIPENASAEDDFEDADCDDAEPKRRSCFDDDEHEEGYTSQNEKSMTDDDDDDPVLDAPTPLASNQVVQSSYCPKYSLPSVKLSIDSNKTGEVRWRNFPTPQPTTRRKLLFEDEDEHEHECQIGTNSNNQSDQDVDDAASVETDPSSNASHCKPRTKTYDPSIAFLSADQFLRMAL